MHVIYYQVVLCKLLTIFYLNKDRGKTSPQSAKVEIKKKNLSLILNLLSCLIVTYFSLRLVEVIKEEIVNCIGQSLKSLVNFS